MKSFYAIAVLIQLVLAFFSGNRNRTSYMLHLLRSMLTHEEGGAEDRKKTNPVISFGKSKNEIDTDHYSFLLER